MRNIILLLMFLSIPLGSAFAQNRTVKGCVIDKETGETLIGASVVVQGREQIGTITDLDGNFVLSIPSGKQKIVVSYIGYTSVTLDPKDTQVVKLATDALGLDEVVVVGYGSAKKRDLTGSVLHCLLWMLSKVRRPVCWLRIQVGLQGQILLSLFVVNVLSRLVMTRCM